MDADGGDDMALPPGVAGAVGEDHLIIALACPQQAQVLTNITANSRQYYSKQFNQLNSMWLKKKNNQRLNRNKRRKSEFRLQKHKIKMSKKQRICVNVRGTSIVVVCFSIFYIGKYIISSSSTSLVNHINSWQNTQELVTVKGKCEGQSFSQDTVVWFDTNTDFSTSKNSQS